MEMNEDVVIVGAGIAGLATALALKKVGIRSLVLERSQELRTTGAALTLFPNAWRALQVLGVDHKLTSIYPSLQRGYITNIASGATQEVYFTGSERKKFEPRAVHRKNLLETLAEELPPGTIRFSSKLSSIETQTFEGSSIAILHLDDGTQIKAKVLIGCDGVHSVVARWLGLMDPVHSGRSAVRGLAVYPQGHKVKDIHQYINNGVRGGFAPLTDKEIYWFIAHNSKPTSGGMEADPRQIQQDVIENSAKDFPSEYLEVVRHAELSTLSLAPLMFRFPWDLIFGKVFKGNITVAGDAMHPMTPDLGQGGCAALEDAVVLGRHLGNLLLQHGRIAPGEVAGALERYTKERRWRAAGLIMGSYISGWVQQLGSGWLMKFLRDTVFYGFLFSKIVDIDYDCGELPHFPLSVGSQTKID
ncbi:PREDICTED: uncharacterized protein LOC104599917 [Nelumbo nucifera]|uniref:Uncharacterized protein LOC104599917 n=1 Tax=Nelumbo nucifera TaxID=4432 RepID=A0A1U8A7D9_NELNU|nr:PREDICTED: uncharacterized protein LOC104599917 [Nelumbo nucifera]